MKFKRHPQEAPDQTALETKVEEPVVEQVEASKSSDPNVKAPTTLEEVEKMTAPELIRVFGNKSNAIRGLAQLGMKPGPISKKLGIIYQHARNVLKMTLKRPIKEQREAAAKAEEQSPTATS